MELVVRRRLAVHAAGSIDPFRTAGVKAQLGGFHGLDVVGMSETSGSEKAQKIFQPSLEQFCGLAAWREGLDRHLHIVLPSRFKIAQAHPGNVMQGEVGVDQHQSIGVAHEVGAFLAEFFHQAITAVSNFLFRLFAEDGMPVSNGPGPAERWEDIDAVTVAQR